MFQLDFIIIGGAKCATTWLQTALQHNPSISMPDPELHYFSREYVRGPVWYADQFPAHKSGALVGEKSNSYLTEPKAAERIRNDHPEIRMILQMRHPVERAYSDYCMLFRRGEVDGDISRHLDPDRAAQARFISDGCYARHIERFLDLFPAEQFLFLVKEDATRSVDASLARVAQHIGHRSPLLAPDRGKVKDKTAAHVPPQLKRTLSPLRSLLDPWRHTAPMQVLRRAVARPIEYPALPPSVRSSLDCFYEPEIRRLKRVTGLDLSTWREMSAREIA